MQSNAEARRFQMGTKHTELTSAPVGRTVDGVIDLLTLRHRSGLEVRILTYGGTVMSIYTPDRVGDLDDIVLGFDTLSPYLDRSPYFGSIIGRYANRIADARFEVDGRTYQLAKNDGPNHLHGGVRGWDKVVWHAAPFEDDRHVGVVLRYTSPAGEEGYPGTVNAAVTYAITAAAELLVEYRATTDAPTVINMTQHSYFNLAGRQSPDILSHELTIAAAEYTPIDASAIPTGQIARVAGTPFDFRKAEPIGARIREKHPQLMYGRGYDHNYVLTKPDATETLAANVFEPVSGRMLTIATTEPGLQFYSGNLLDGTLTGKGARVYGRHAGFCLEPQHFPNSPNESGFPSAVLRPGQEYTSTTLYAFTVR
jgi:aldose 1-epimerase